MNITYSSHIDGIIVADGRNARSNNAGGGSGGSVLIETENFAGHGTISSKGGNGIGVGGGGSGGRVAIHISWRREFQGLSLLMVSLQNKHFSLHLLT